MTTLEQYDLIAEQVHPIKFAGIFIAQNALNIKEHLNTIETALNKITQDPDRVRIIGDQTYEKLRKTQQRIQRIHELLNSAELGSFSLQLERLAEDLWRSIP